MRRVINGVRTRMLVEESDGHTFVKFDETIRTIIFRCNICGIEAFTFNSEMSYFRYDNAQGFPRRLGAFTCDEFKLRNIIS